MIMTNFAIKDFIKISLFTKIQLYKTCVIYGVVFKTICVICVIRCFYLGAGLWVLNKKTNFVVLLCVLRGLCVKLFFGGEVGFKQQETQYLRGLRVIKMVEWDGF
jgi:hypothetical protein